jgi:hypothetical protein
MMRNWRFGWKTDPSMLNISLFLLEVLFISFGLLQILAHIFSQQVLLLWVSMCCRCTVTSLRSRLGATDRDPYYNSLVRKHS